MKIIPKKLKDVVHTHGKSRKESCSASDSLTSLFSAWPGQLRATAQHLPAADVQTGRTVQATEFYLFYVSVLLLVVALGLGTASIWSITYRIPFASLVDCSTEIAYFTLPSALLCFPCFWILLSVHNDEKPHKYLSIVLIILIFVIAGMILAVYVAFTHPLHVKVDQTEKSAKLMQNFRMSMLRSLMQYNGTEQKRKSWDQIQKRLGCCGIQDYTDWYHVGSRKVPRSCRADYKLAPGCLRTVIIDLSLHTCLLTGLNCVALIIQCCTFIGVAGIYFDKKRKVEA